MAIGKLVAKAKQFNKTNRQYTRYSDEHIELAMAWVRDEITLSQVAHALEMNTVSKAYVFLAIALKQVIKTGVK